MMPPSCCACDEPIAPGDRFESTRVVRQYGMTVELIHAECQLRALLGGIGHHEDHAFWCVQMGDPDGGRSFRQSALEVDRLAREGLLHPGD